MKLRILSEEKAVTEKTMSAKVVAPRGTKFRKINMSRKVSQCPRCGGLSKRHSIGRRRLREVGISGPTILEVTYSKHYCERCRRHFSLPMEHLAPAGGRFTHRVRRAAVAMVVAQALALDKAALRMRQKYFIRVSPSTLHDWVVEAMVA